MLAEIRGKIENHMEDELTGNVFGTLRYTDFDKILKPLILKCVRPSKIAEDFDQISCGYWADKVEFWKKYGYTEPDIVLNLDSATILIEMKYLSGLSSRDQIERESEVLTNFNTDKKILLLIGKKSTCLDVVTASKMDKIANEFGVKLGFIAWEDFFDELKSLKDRFIEKTFERLIIDDLIQLLAIKGFERFRSFDVELEIFADDYFRFCRVEKFDRINFTCDMDIDGDNFYEFQNH